MKTTLKIYIIVAVAVMGLLGVGWYYISRDAEEPHPGVKFTIDEARVKDLREMVELCSLEIFEETGVNDTINGKGLFAVMKVKGSIRFDIEKLKVDSIGVDSIRITLPPERVELLESTDPSSYRVIDVWNVRYPLLSVNITAAEENQLKRRALAKLKRRVYERGYVRQARESAAETLRKIYGMRPGIYLEVAEEPAG